MYQVCLSLSVTTALILSLGFGRIVLCAQVKEVALAVNKTYRAVTLCFGEVKGTL